MGSEPLISYGIGLAFYFTSLLFRLFAPLSFYFPPPSNSAFPFGAGWRSPTSTLSIYASLCLLFGLLSIIIKIATKTPEIIIKLDNRRIRRTSKASRTTRLRLMAAIQLQILQTHDAYTRFGNINDEYRTDYITSSIKGMIDSCSLTNAFILGIGFMTSRLWELVCIILVFGLGFTSCKHTLAPGKGIRTSARLQTRRPLAMADRPCSKDVSLSAENLWTVRTWTQFMTLRSLVALSCLMATAESLNLPQADLVNILSAWTSGLLSGFVTLYVTVNFLGSPEFNTFLAAKGKKRAYTSPLTLRSYDHTNVGGYIFTLSPTMMEQLDNLCRSIFPALHHAITSAPFSYATTQEVADLAETDEEDPFEHNSDSDNDDAVTSFDGSRPASPITTHPDNSQFSTIALQGTPNIIRTADSRVTNSPSIIREARHSTAPYTPKSGSAAPTRPPSRSALPSSAAQFGLPVRSSTATPVQTTTNTALPPATLIAPIAEQSSSPLSYINETPKDKSLTLPAPTTSPKPYFNQISVELPRATPTITGLIPEEWALFRKQVEEYNLTHALYKDDLNWKQQHLNPPTSKEESYEYFQRIGSVNQRVGVIALMEANIGKYINTVGVDLVKEQARIDKVNLRDNIDWFTWQGSLQISKLLEKEGIPFEDIDPRSYPTPIPATPAETAQVSLPPATPVPAPETILVPETPTAPANTSIAKAKQEAPAPLFFPSPSLSELTPLTTPTAKTLTFGPATPKASQMSISPDPSPSRSQPTAQETDVEMTTIQRQRVDDVLDEYRKKAKTDVEMTTIQRQRVEEVLDEYRKQAKTALESLLDSRQRNREAETLLALEKAKLIDAENKARAAQKAMDEQLATAKALTPSTESVASYIPPSQRPGSEAYIAARGQTNQTSSSLLSSIPSSVLPSRPNYNDQTETATKKVTTAPHEFAFKNGAAGFQELRVKLLNLQSPLRASRVAAHENNEERVVISTKQATDLDNLLTFLMKVNEKAENSLTVCPTARQIGPYPALGLAWTALANNSSSIDMTTSKIIHSLTNSITVVNVNRNVTQDKIPVPIIPGILPPRNVVIKSKEAPKSTMVSKTSIKNHPQKEEIVKLAQSLLEADPVHISKAKHARDYLTQARQLLESGNAPITRVTTPRSFANVASNTARNTSKGNTATRSQEKQVFPPKMPPTGIPVSKPNKQEWQKIQRKKATRQGTKASEVTARVPITHQIPRHIMLLTDENKLKEHFAGVLGSVSGVEALLQNNALKSTKWSLNREFITATYHSPIDSNLRLMTHEAFVRFFNVTDDTVPHFVERPTTSSVKWASVPCFNADNVEITEKELGEQILHQGLYNALKVVNGPMWIIPTDGYKGAYATVKLDFEDNRAGDNLKVLINKNIFINGKSCRTLPWINKASTPQCSQCLRWGHTVGSCLSNMVYCAICTGRHLTKEHSQAVARKDKIPHTVACINCLAAGLTHDHKATDRDCPFFVERNNKTHITELLQLIKNRRLEGHFNPFGLTKVRHSQSSGASQSSYSRPSQKGRMPTEFLTRQADYYDSSDHQFNLASSNDSLFRNVPPITASQIARIDDETHDLPMTL